MGKFQDLTGRSFGFLTVESLSGRDERLARPMWSCLCVCGKRVVKLGDKPRGGLVKSCGCMTGQMLSDSSKRHGHTRGGRVTSEFAVWSSMKSRCTNPMNHAYQRYGGRGIKVCDRWLNSFEAFLADVGPKPRGMSLDRIDVNGDYEPGNVRWATTKEQCRNMRSNVMLTAMGRTMCIAEWAEETGIRPSTIRQRVKHGWSHEEAVARVDGRKVRRGSASV